MSSLTNKVIIVTGGAASIGASIVRYLHECGAYVVIADVQEEQGLSLASTLGERVAFIKMDLRQDSDIKRLIEQTVTDFGGLDVLINNACVYGDQGSQTSRDVWLDTLNVNVVASALLGEQAREQLAKRHGCIVNIGSVSGHFPHIGRWAYPVSKAAVKHLTKSQAVDYAVDKIRVNSLVLGYIWSDPISTICGGDREKADAMSAPYNLMQRAADPCEIGKAVAFLISSDASYITGSEINVDGGYSALGPEQYFPLNIPS